MVNWPTELPESTGSADCRKVALLLSALPRGPLVQVGAESKVSLTMTVWAWLRGARHSAKAVRSAGWMKRAAFMVWIRFPGNVAK